MRMDGLAEHALGELSLALSIALLKASGHGWSKQPRVPGGPKGGQWTSTGGGGAAVATQALTAPHLGQGGVAVRRFGDAPEQAVFTAPLKDTEITGLPAYLDNPHGFVLKNPSKPTDVENNDNPDDVATYTAGTDPGKGLNGVPFTEWNGPKDGDWTKVTGTGSFSEPPVPNPKGKRLGAGVVIEEPDGRIWTVEPLNSFGGYKETFPKGGIEEGLDLRQTAIKEAFEESGLKVELTGHLADVERTTSVARYYRAKRVGGDPTKFHWETQAANLVPLTELADRVVHHADAPIIAALAGEGSKVQKALSAVADLIDFSEPYLGNDLEKAKGGAWSKQLRVPAGLPTGGQWTTYGSGGIGSAYAAGGQPLKLQMHGGTGPQSEQLNAKIQGFQDAANMGVLHPAAAKLLAGSPPAQTYSSAAYQSAAEAAAYVGKGGAAPGNLKSNTAEPSAASSPAKPSPAPKGFGPKVDGEVDAPAITAQAAKLKAGGWPNTALESAKTSGEKAAAAAALADSTGKTHYLVDEGTSLGAMKVFHGEAGAALYAQHGGYKFDPDGKAYYLPAGKAGLTPTPAAKPKEWQQQAGTAADPLKLGEMKKIASKPGGSAAGAIYETPDGTKWLVKSYSQQSMAANEVIASKIYNMLGIETPHMKMVDLGGEYHGGLGVASKMIDGFSKLDPNNPQHLSSVQKQFGAHALLANWDAVGLSFDNTVIGSKGEAVMVDPGGSLLHRATGGLKGAEFGGEVKELDTMRDPSVNPTAAKIFAPMSEHALIESALGAAATYQKNIVDINKMIDAHAVGTAFDAAKVKSTMALRASNLLSKAKAMEAAHASTATVDISTTGTQTGALLHHDPFTQQMANTHSAADLDASIPHWTATIEGHASSLEGKSAAFYSTKIVQMGKLADAGDVDGVKAVYESGPSSAAGKSSANYGAFLKAKQAATMKAQIVAAASLKAHAKPGDGSFVTGGAKVTAAEVSAAKKLAGDSPDAPVQNLATAKALADAVTPAAKPAEPQAYTVLPPIPVKPKLSSPANANLKLTKQADEIEALVKEGGAGAAAKIQAIASQISGTNSFSKKAKQYAADAVAALGGQKAIDVLPASDKKAALETGLAQGNTTIKNFGALTVEERHSTVKFDPDNIPEPPDFKNWNGPGGGLSSKPGVNDINNAIVGSMYAAAKSNDITALEKIDPGPSQHSQTYKKNLVGLLGQVGTVITKTKLVGFDGSSKIDGAAAAKDIGAAFKAKPNWAPDATKFHKFVEAGSIDAGIAKAVYSSIPEHSVTAQSAAAAAMLKATKNASNSDAIAAMKYHTGSGYIELNATLRDGVPGSASHDKALARAAAIESGSTDLPAGLLLSRKVNIGGFSDWSAKKGTIITEPGITSTSINPNVWSGNVYLRLKIGAGVKGAYVGPAKGESPISVNSGEHEVILPRNTKWLIADVRKDDGNDTFFKGSAGKTIVDIVVLPNDPVK